MGYTIWTPDGQNSLYNKDQNVKREHVWICAPGGMESIDPAMTALYERGMFNGSKICFFNNPGISNKINTKPLPSPTNTKYLIQFIDTLQTKHNLDVSLIGFSIGCVQALRTLHYLNNTDKRKKIKIKSVKLVHAPDIVRESVCSCRNNWLIRM